MCEGMTWHTKYVLAKLKKKRKKVHSDAFLLMSHVQGWPQMPSVWHHHTPRGDGTQVTYLVFGHLWLQLLSRALGPIKTKRIFFYSPQERQPQLKETHGSISLLGSNAWTRSCPILCCSNKALGSSSLLPRPGRQWHCKEEVRRLWSGLSLFIICSHCSMKNIWAILGPGSRVQSCSELAACPRGYRVLLPAHGHFCARKLNHA